MNNIRLFFVFFSAFVLSSCVSQGVNLVPPSIKVNYADNFRVNFSGRGAGAGMMMMGSMGPMGIAIGVAIDEGIAKDIRTALADSGKNIDGIVSDSLLASWRRGCIEAGSSAVICQASQGIVVDVESVSFVSKGDDVSPKFSIVIDVSDHKVILPTDELFLQENAPTATLDAIKKEGFVSAKLLQQYLEKSFDKLIVE